MVADSLSGTSRLTVVPYGAQRLVAVAAALAQIGPGQSAAADSCAAVVPYDLSSTTWKHWDGPIFAAMMGAAVMLLVVMRCGLWCCVALHRGDGLEQQRPKDIRTLAMQSQVTYRRVLDTLAPCL